MQNLAEIQAQVYKALIPVPKNHACLGLEKFLTEYNIIIFKPQLPLPG